MQLLGSQYQIAKGILGRGEHGLSGKCCYHWEKISSENISTAESIVSEIVVDSFGYYWEHICVCVCVCVCVLLLFLYTGRAKQSHTLMSWDVTPCKLVEVYWLFRVYTTTSSILNVAE
jgi:hypothetical protein